MLKYPVLCVVIVLVLFVLLTAGYLWVDSVPKDRARKHKRINNVRGMTDGRVRRLGILAVIYRYGSNLLHMGLCKRLHRGQKRRTKRKASYRRKDMKNSFD